MNLMMTSVQFNAATASGNAALATVTNQVNAAIDLVETNTNLAFDDSKNKINVGIGTITTQVNEAFTFNTTRTNTALGELTTQTVDAANDIAAQGSNIIEQLRIDINANIVTLLNSETDFPIVVVAIPARTGFGGTTEPGTSILNIATAGTSILASAMSGVPDILGSSMTPPTMSMFWTPIGATTPMLLSFTQFAGLIDAINTRRFNLNQAAIVKRAAINALATMAAVIAYDVTTGW